MVLSNQWLLKAFTSILVSRHAHVHGFLGHSRSLGHFRNLNEGGLSYAQHTGRNYFLDYASSHIAIGLGIR